MNENTNSGHHRISKSLYVLAILGILGLVAFFIKLNDVFPAASIDLRLSKEQIAQKAHEVMRATGHNDQGYIESTTFSSRDYQQIFIEHEYNAREANDLMRNDVPIWLWSTRFCKEQQYEEFWVTLGTDGQLRQWYQSIEDDKALPELTHEQAQELARNFAKQHAHIVLPVDEDSQTKIKLIEDGTVQQSKRTDHYFTWEDNSKDFKGGRMRTSMYVSGNVVSDFNYSLHVPDSFDRRYNTIRSYNSLFSSIAQVLFAVLSCSLLFVFVWALSTHQVKWRLTLTIGALAFLESCLSTANSWPVIMQGYETTKTMQQFLMDKTIAALVSGLMSGLSATVLIGAAEPLYRKFFPEKLAIQNYWSKQALRTKQLAESLLAGVSMFGVQLGWITLFYLVGKMLGVWSPLQMREVAVLSSVVPAYSSLTMAIDASVFEELLCRVLCLVLVQKITGNFWIANLVQAVGWAFMHSDYPQEPAFVRGLELSFVGFWFGMLVRRFGILPSITSHYTYNCLLGSLPLFFAGSPGLLASALVVVSPGFIWAALSMAGVRSKGLTNEQGMCNADVTVTHPPRVSEADPQLDYHYSPLNAKARLALITAGAAGIALAFLPYAQIADETRLTVTREEAVHAAEAYMLTRGISPEGWQTSVELRSNLDDEEIQYGFQKEGFQKLKGVFANARYPLIWYVRFFKPLVPEQYEVMVNPSGRAIGLDITKEDDAEANTISEADARTKVEEFLQKQRAELAPIRFLSASQTKRSKRTDHTFVYEAPQLKLGDARLKVTINTVGDAVDRPTVNWDIPDSWRFERKKETLRTQLAQYGGWGISIVLIGCAIVWLIGLLRSQSIHWRPGLIAGLVFALARAAETLNDIPGMICSYATDTPLASFWTQVVMGKFQSFLLSSALVAFLGVISFAAFRLLRPKDSITAYFRKCFRPVSEDERMFAKQTWSDALIFAYSATAVTIGLDELSGFLSAKFSPSAAVASFSTITESSLLFSPAVGAFYQSIAMTVITLLCIPIGIGLYAKYARNLTRYFLIVTVYAMISYAGHRYWQNFVIDVADFLVTAGMYYLFVRYLVRGNILGYAFFLYLGMLARKVIDLATYAGKPYASDVAIAILFLLLPLAIGLVRINTPPRNKSESAQ